MGAPQTRSTDDVPRGEPLPFVEVSVPLPVVQSFTYRVPEEMQRADVAGRAVTVPFRGRELVGVVLSGSKAASRSRLRSILRWHEDPYRLDATSLEMARWIAEYYGSSLGETLGLFLPPRPGTRAAARAQDQAPSPDLAIELDIELNLEQRHAVDEVLAVLREPRFASFLLQGITGSGKTEVYLRLLAETLERGRSGLVLLPEIALTPQTLERLEERFPGQVAAYHSRLSHGERCAVWEAAARGELPIVVGPRSAGFVPRPDLGLIVVDEEHDGSYKAEDRPRYHARDVALWRARQHSIPIVLGSATPSLESWHHARSGKHHHLRLRERVGGPGGLPEVEIVDRREPGPDSEPLSGALVTALEECLGRGEQAILFYNRRGFARWLQCRQCGEVVPCPRCDISLTYHLHGDRLHCHYCGYERAAPRNCDACGAGPLYPHGSGTQRVEVALGARFPEAKVLRMDQDSTGRKHSHREILESFRRGEADLLVGTQMVAKGLHFPRVTLVGVVDADVGLHFPDFRAHERAFALLTQVAGRSGRGRPGRVLIQTYDPEHRVLAAARTHDVESFLEAELAERRALSYPPFTRLCAVMVSAPDEDRLEAALDWLAQALRSRLRQSGVQLLGPARAMMPRVNRRYRGQILLKGALAASAKREILSLFAELKSRPAAGRLDLQLDVDPSHLL